VSSERISTPAAAVMTSAFVDGATRMAEALGVPGYPFVVISHPISSATDVELETKARAALHQARPLLITGGVAVALDR
jgi:hypothetical protein